MYVQATVVDHIKPHQGDPELFWDSENLQALCAPCHSRKTASEDGGFGN
jgi:5-methylcytosine-specific restriction protein A